MFNNSLIRTLVVASALLSQIAGADVAEVEGGFRVEYSVNLGIGSSNGSDIVDVYLFEWDDHGNFSAVPGPVISGRGASTVSHVIGFEPRRALVLGWGAAIPGIGDEKDHLFMLANSAFTESVRGQQWSAAFPGIPPEPRIGHSAMVQLLQNAASGDSQALTDLANWVQREAGSASFDPDGRFRVIEWSIAQPIDITPTVPSSSLVALAILVFAISFVVLIRHRRRGRVTSLSSA